MRGLAAKKHRGSEGACAGGLLLLQLSAPDSANCSPFFSPLYSGASLPFSSLCKYTAMMTNQTAQLEVVGCNGDSESVEASCVFHPINVH